MFFSWLASQLDSNFGSHENDRRTRFDPAQHVSSFRFRSVSLYFIVFDVFLLSLYLLVYDVFLSLSSRFRFLQSFVLFCTQKRNCKKSSTFDGVIDFNFAKLE
jgi:hypothetical protein